MELLVYDGTERRMRRYQLEEGEPLPFAGGVTAGELLSDGYGAPLWSSRAFLEALAALAETAGPLALRRGLDRRELGPFLFGQAALVSGGEKLARQAVRCGRWQQVRQTGQGVLLLQEGSWSRQGPWQPPVLQKGESGPAVAALQWMLGRAGYSTAVDGRFDDRLYNLLCRCCPQLGDPAGGVWRSGDWPALCRMAGVLPEIKQLFLKGT